MLPAFLTIFLFAFSSIASERVSRLLGAVKANMARLTIASGIMALITLAVFRDSLAPQTFGWLALSGGIGFGLGDIVMFMGYVRIGARITILLTLCTAPLWSAVGEKVWMGIGLRPYEIAASGVILLGVTLAILSRDPGRKGGQGNYWAGVVFALIGGAGQGLGAVVSRKAYAVAQEQGVPLEGFSAAAQRVVSGWLGAFLMLTLLRSLMGGREFLNFSNTPWKKVWPWLLASTFCGPVVGVTCFQWALATTPSAIVNTLVATTPIAMIPLAMLINKDRPGILSVLGALIAVAGVLLMLNRGG